VNLFAKASAISAELIPKESSLGTSKGSLKRLGELHLKALFSSTSLAVEAGMYLKKLVRSWSRFGERGIWLPRKLTHNSAAPSPELSKAVAVIWCERVYCKVGGVSITL
jgi:hypothetical protein